VNRLGEVLLASSIELRVAERAGETKLSTRRVLRAVAALPDVEREALIAEFLGKAAEPSRRSAPEIALLPCDGCDNVSPADELTETQDGRQLCGHCLLEQPVRWTRGEAQAERAYDEGAEQAGGAS
jgi:hypothetical protein